MVVLRHQYREICAQQTARKCHSINNSVLFLWPASCTLLWNNIKAFKLILSTYMAIALAALVSQFLCLTISLGRRLTSSRPMVEGFKKPVFSWLQVPVECMLDAQSIPVFPFFRLVFNCLIEQLNKLYGFSFQ